MSGMKCLYSQHHESFPPILPSQVGVSGKGAKAPITQYLGHGNSVSESSARKSLVHHVVRNYLLPAQFTSIFRNGEVI